jgi:hypothetical protein
MRGCCVRRCCTVASASVHARVFCTARACFCSRKMCGCLAAFLPPYLPACLPILSLQGPRHEWHRGDAHVRDGPQRATHLVKLRDAWDGRSSLSARDSAVAIASEPSAAATPTALCRPRFCLFGDTVVSHACVTCASVQQGFAASHSSAWAACVRACVPCQLDFQP